MKNKLITNKNKLNFKINIVIHYKVKLQMNFKQFYLIIL